MCIYIYFFILFYGMPALKFAIYKACFGSLSSASGTGRGDRKVKIRRAGGNSGPSGRSGGTRFKGKPAI